MCMRKYVQIYYITKVCCMVQHICIVFSQRSDNNLKVKIVAKFDGSYKLLKPLEGYNSYFPWWNFVRAFENGVDEVRFIYISKDYVTSFPCKNFIC